MQDDDQQNNPTPPVTAEPTPAVIDVDPTPDGPLVSQMSFAPSANTPEWVFTFQREFRAHEQRIATLEFAMAEIVRLKSEQDATKTELAAANAQVASLQKQILVRSDAKLLQQIRIARGIQHARHYLRSAIAHDFEQQGFLSADQVDVILRGVSLVPIADAIHDKNTRKKEVILIHMGYSVNFLAALAKRKLEPITNFDQFAVANLNDLA
ncbi:hypothetical protein MBANPS3_011444 [Mucor bainieri]